MANPHSNTLAIVADEENMTKVMRLLWESYEKAAQETGFDEERPHRFTPKRFWKFLRPYLEQSYEYAFRKDFLGSKGNRVVGERTTASGMKMVLSIAPWGRPYGEAATVDLTESGQRFIFRMQYVTAWISNFDHDVFDFMKRLPEGEYGIAFLDADEQRGREGVSVRSYLWLGQGKAESKSTSDLDDREITARFAALKASDVDSLDLADHALREGMREWATDSELEEAAHSGDLADHQEEPEAEEKERDRSCELTGLVGVGPAHFDEVWSLLVEALTDLPLLVGVSGTAYRTRERSIASLMAGDELVLKSNWESPYFSPVGIEAFTIHGESIGNLVHRSIHGRDYVSDTLRVVLALVLPHVRPVVAEIIPLFMRRASATASHLLVRLDLEVLDWDALKEEVELMLGQTLAERARETPCEDGESRVAKLTPPSPKPSEHEPPERRRSDADGGVSPRKRHVRNASLRDLIELYRQTFDTVTILPGDDRCELLPKGIEGIDIAHGVELREAILTVPSEGIMLNIDTRLVPLIEEGPDGNAVVGFAVEGQEERPVAMLAPGQGGILGALVFKGESPLSAYEECVVASTVESPDTPGCLQIRFCYSHELEAATLLHVLVWNGSITREQLREGIDEPRTIAPPSGRPDKKDLPHPPEHEAKKASEDEGEPEKSFARTITPLAAISGVSTSAEAMLDEACTSQVDISDLVKVISRLTQRFVSAKETMSAALASSHAFATDEASVDRALIARLEGIARIEQRALPYLQRILDACSLQQRFDLSAEESNELMVAVETFMVHALAGPDQVIEGDIDKTALAEILDGEGIREAHLRKERLFAEYASASSSGGGMTAQASLTSGHAWPPA